ncbi:MAG: ABC transporter ATP-binding protein [Verrucomicrobiia bacterium]
MNTPPSDSSQKPPSPRRSLSYFLRGSWRMLTDDEKRVVRTTMWQLLAVRLVAGVTLIIVARQSGMLTGALMQSSPWLTAFCIFVGLTLLNVPLEYFRSYWAEALRERLSKLFQFRVFEYMQAQSVDFFMNRNPGELMRQLGKATTAVQFLLCDTVVLALSDIIFLVAYIAYLFLLNWQLTLLLLAACSAIPFVIVWFIYPTLERVSFERNELDNVYGGKMFEGIIGVKEIQLNNAQGWIIGEMRQLTEDLIGRNLRVERWEGINHQTTSLIGTITMLVILGAGSWLVITQQLAGGWPELFVFYTLVPSVFSLLVSLCSTSARYTELRPQVAEGFDILETPPRVVDRPDAQAMPPLRNKIAFRNVTFAYSPDAAPVLRDLTFEIKAGQRVALVGRRGCGKSTIFNLLCRFLETEDGQGVVELDGVDIRRYTMTSLRAQFGMVTQKPFFKHASVKENLLLAKPDATEEQIIRACQDAQIHDVIERKSDGECSGYDTNVNAFSGGEQISIAIARCYLRQPSIILLDEPLASLSADVASDLLISLKKLTEGRTCIIISHALQGVADVDQIFVLGYQGDRRGRLVQQGTHQELKNQPGYYHELYEKQILCVY